jgi:hypothetical protein
MSARNTCKTCALGIGGQRGGMRNEGGKWPEVCKKSLQAMVADIQGALRPDYFRTMPTTGHVRGCGRETLILPVRARYEEDPTTQESMFNFVRLSDGGPARYEGPTAEISSIAKLGTRVLEDNSPVRWIEMHECLNIRQLIANAVPGYESLATIDRSKREFQIPGRTFDAERFTTPSDQAHFAAISVPPERDGRDELRLMTIRSEGQFNTVPYAEEDIYRGQDRRGVILTNPEEIRRRDVKADQVLSVRSAVGVMRRIRVRPDHIRAGNAATYYPEAELLVPPVVDPVSKTPAFTCFSILLAREPATADSDRPNWEPVGSSTRPSIVAEEAHVT